jgi:hypothetical protein
LPQKYHDVLNYDKGEPIVIKIPYTGSPLPNVTLTKDGQDMTKDKNVSIDVSDRGITLTIRNGDKNTSGPYKIKLDNALGEDEATLRIHVSGNTCTNRIIVFHMFIVDVPGIPREPQVESISDESVKLSWRPPDDDGGSYITNYIIEKLDPDTGKWTKAGTSRFAHGTVENLQPKKQYQFRVLAENVFGAGEPSAPSKTIQTSGKSSSTIEYI